MKKNTKNKIALILGIVSLVISGWLIYRYFYELRFEEKTIELTTEGCEENCLNINLNYLRCKGGSNFAKNFNAEIESQVANFLLSNEDTLQVDDISIEKALETFMTDYNTIHEHFPDIPAYELTLSDSIMWKNEKMLTLVSNRYSFTGGAQPVITKVFTHFALNDGSVITNENLFTDEKKVAEIAEKYVREAQKQSTIETLNDKGFWFEDNQFCLPKNIGVAADGLILFYEPFEIASYMNAPFEVKIPMNEISAYLAFKK
ncbi:DUF3298 and DUF4163 domain-containing protein [Capnocytophaga sp. oral taxon 878]|uniref:DUF3298 and DUF4163 domain-containing protein n=1 Tax=Capnocytophaga sp. oral taxon 878 TaxID=1316596 RepID=UPI000D02F466|nr:DUF3298 and DUF4163 domain-containing protein [Capnocytophaga sp. oral taxon 878]AVM51307.1 hypothetical protein C4H12_13015 [Capnocytophaga sp. oral taxon 878]